jgi:PKD repeat protein
VRAGGPVEIRATSLAGGVPFTVHFAARVPRAGAVVEWDFGDGDGSRDPRAYHTYVEPGIYQVRLTVRFGDGSASEATLQVIAHTGG